MALGLPLTFDLGRELRSIVISILFALVCQDAGAQTRPVTVALLNPDAIGKYVEGFKHLRLRPLKFRMGSITGTVDFKATALVTGPMESANLIGILRALNLSSVVAEMDGPWQVKIFGDNLAAEVLVSPVFNCSKSARMRWLLSNQGNRWLVVERLPAEIPDPVLCEPRQ